MIKAKNCEIPGYGAGSARLGKAYSNLAKDFDEFIAENLETAELEVSFQDDMDEKQRYHAVTLARQNAAQFLKRHEYYRSRIKCVQRKSRLFIVRRKDGDV